MRPILKAVLLALLSCLPITAQSPQLERGIELYRAANYAGALTVLEELSVGAGKKDAIVWNYVGLCHLRLRNAEKAEKALENAVKLAPDNSAVRANYGFAMLQQGKTKRADEAIAKALLMDPKNASAYLYRGIAHFRRSEPDEALVDAEKAISLDAGLASAYDLKSRTYFARLNQRIPEASREDILAAVQNAIGTVELCIAKCSDSPETSALTDRLTDLNAFRTYLEAGNKLVSEPDRSTDSTITKIRFVVRPIPKYSIQARDKRISGVVRLLVAFKADGEVGEIVVVKSVGYGLEEESIRAARGIKFDPAKRNGIPITVVKLVEYTFDTY